MVNNIVSYYLVNWLIVILLCIAVSSLIVSINIKSTPPKIMEKKLKLLAEKAIKRND